MSKSKRRRKSPHHYQQEIENLQRTSSDTLKPAFHVAAIVLLVTLGTIAYSNSFSGPFIFDDVRNIVENPHIQVKHFTAQNFYQAAANSRAPRPVAYLSFALNYYFGEFDVTGYHLVNLIIHLFSGILVYALAWQTYQLYFGQQQSQSTVTSKLSICWMSFLAACLFVLHPLQTQAVVFVVQRMTSLATMFYLLALLFYILGRLVQQQKLCWAYFTGSIVTGLLALGSKQIAATLPITIMLYEWFFFQNLSSSWIKQQSKKVLVLAAVVILIVWICLGENPWQRMTDIYSTRNFTLLERLLTQSRVVVQYLSLIVLPFPSRLNLIHDVTVSTSLLNPPTTLASLLFIFFSLAVAIRIARTQRLLSFGILWFFTNLVIESSIIPLELMYEHRVYLPMFGLALILPYLLFSCLPRYSYAVAAISCLLLVGLSWGTYQRNADWQHEFSFWEDVIDKNSKSHRAFVERGKLLAKDGKLQLAIADYDKATELNPNFATAYSNRAAAYGQLGIYDQSLADCHRAIELEPKSAAAYNNRGTVYNLLGKQEMALADYDKALAINPRYTDAYFNRANIYFALSKFQQAIADYEQTIALYSNYVNAYNNRAMSHQQLGNYRLAIDDLAKSNQLQPDNPQTLTRLALLLATSPQAEDRNASQAMEYARQACDVTSQQDPLALQAYAAAAAENGKFNEAIQWQNRAIQLAPENQKRSMQALLKLYLAKKAFRLPTKK